MTKQSTQSKSEKSKHPETDEAQLKGVKLAQRVVLAAYDKKANDADIIDVRGIVDYTDFVVVLSGRSDRQVSAIAKHIQRVLANDFDVKCMGVEGLPQANWVLLDFSEVVVHIFHEDVRGYYNLDGLWIDAKRVPLPEERPGGDAGVDAASESDDVFSLLSSSARGAHDKRG